MLPIAIALLAGGAGGGLLGYLYGHSKAQSEVERLIKVVKEYDVIVKRNEQKINVLESKISRLESEIEEIQKNRNFIERLIVLIRGECPEVLDRFMTLEESRKVIKKAEDETRQAEKEAEDCYMVIKNKYPAELDRWENDKGLKK